MTFLVVVLAGSATGSSAPRFSTPIRSNDEVSLEIQRFVTSDDVEMDHFVGAVDSQLFIGVALSDPDARNDASAEDVIYLCGNRNVSTWLIGEVTDGTRSLAVDEAIVEVSLDGTDVWRTVILPDGRQRGPLDGEGTDIMVHD